MGTTKPVYPEAQTNGQWKPADQNSVSGQASVGKSLSIQRPFLQINTHELVFPAGGVSKPRFLTFTLAQQHADTPVIISTDAPDVFQLASDSRPAFAPSLTLIPPAKAIYIHVRYAPTRAGKHSAQLIIEAPYGSQTIQLEARSAGFLPAIISGPVVTTRKQPAQTNRWRVVVGLFVAGCLLIAGYRYRCELAPSLCREPVSTANGQQSLPTAKIPPRIKKRTDVSVSRTRSAGRSSRKKTREAARTGRIESKTGGKTINSPAKTANQTSESQEPSPQGDARPAGRSNPPRSAPITTARQTSQQPAGSSPSRRRTNVSPASEESDLERELNKKPDNP